MKISSRRKFLGMTALAAASGTAMLTTSCDSQHPDSKYPFIHHVFFWLKNPGSKEDQAKLIEGLRKLATVPTIATFHIGVPASTNRDVIDSTYAASWCAFFKNDADQASYQTDPIHLEFIEEYGDLWEKVIVYDSIDV
ncbi:MAG: Dabb family protein [Cyclobacteriaceae bacterium]|nr:Dabb family protein [Cyclobacteriaceae bacterium]